MTADREDLGALLHRLTQALVRRELPLLQAHGLDMWEYAVLSRLRSGSAPTQAQLAEAVGRDATRIIPVLDRLQARGLLERTPDPRDRRNRVVALTPAGHRTLAACRDDVHDMEDEALRILPPDARTTLRTALSTLAEHLT
jgi:DNA-binding MarR family transcriptional regulator